MDDARESDGAPDARANDLGKALRSWRDRADPVEAGVQSSGGRRLPGLRREEVAAQSGLSVDYLTRLEQGRASHPSVQVLAALARTLVLSADERDYLYRLAGQAPPSSGVIDGHITPGIRRLTERLRDLPVGVYDAAWNLVAWNPLWTALMGDPGDARGRERNLPWRYFSSGGERGRVVQDEAGTAAFEADMVADLRAATARYPRDHDLASLIGALRQTSERFEQLWERAVVAVRTADRKTIDHPDVGPLTLDCDVLTVQGSDLRIVAYSAAEGSEAAEKLRLLAVLGTASR
jgi:transcriptional regulator with XRE-family HTH domain